MLKNSNEFEILLAEKIRDEQLFTQSEFNSIRAVKWAPSKAAVGRLNPNKPQNVRLANLTYEHNKKIDAILLNKKEKLVVDFRPFSIPSSTYNFIANDEKICVYI